MVYQSSEKKAHELITYAISEASTISDGVDCFNLCAPDIKSKTIEELKEDIDNHLA